MWTNVEIGGNLFDTGGLRMWGHLMRRVLPVVLITVAWVQGLAQSSLPVCPTKASVVWMKCFGTATFPDGKRCVGEWDNDQFNGQGMLTLPSGDKYMGEFKDDKYDGSGIYTRANGERIFGDWKRGNLIRAADGKANQSDSTRSMDAQVRSNALANGQNQDAQYSNAGQEDSVARRLRIAAEQEKDPELHAALWTEYRDYMSSRQQAEREAEARRRERYENQQKLLVQKQQEQQDAALEAERRQQAALQEEQQRRAEEQEQMYWACVGATQARSLLEAMSKCRAEALRSSVSNSDYEWDWDQYYNQYGRLVWSCRGVQTGQFAELSRCASKYRTDARWPQK